MRFICDQMSTFFKDNLELELTRRVAEVVRDLAGRGDAPARLLLGADAVPMAQQAARELAANDEAWREVGLSVSDGMP